MVNKKSKLSLSIDSVLIRWADSQVEQGKFDNRSQVIEHAAQQLKNRIKSPKNEKIPKKKIYDKKHSISLHPAIDKWIKSQVAKKIFGNSSHAIEYSVTQLMNRTKARDKK